MATRGVATVTRTILSPAKRSRERTKGSKMPACRTTEKNRIAKMNSVAIGTTATDPFWANPAIAAGAKPAAKAATIGTSDNTTRGAATPRTRQ